MLGLEDPRVPRLVAALLESGHRLAGGTDASIGLEKDGNMVWLAVARDGHSLELPDLGKVGAVTAVAVGGGPERQAELRKARPTFTQGPVTLAQVGEGGQVWVDGARRTSATDLLARLAELPDPEPEAFRARLAQQIEEVRLQHAEALAFNGVLTARPPVVTYGLLAIIAVFFALELAFGGSETPPTLVRLGALLRGEALGAGWFRMLSCSFLHAGVMHLAFNSYVLWAIGRFLEPILGSLRFLTLYVLSCLGGSLASATLLGEGYSVGASGAIWGLLAAEGVLAYRPAGLLPQAILPQMKKAAIINLVLNILYSLRPEVDWAAHAGGGVVGGLLIFAGILTVGLPRLGEPARDGALSAREPAWLRPLAVALGALLVGASVYAVVAGQAWKLMEAPRLHTLELTQQGLQIDVPDSLAEVERADPVAGAEQRVLGDLMQDPAVVDVFAGRFDGPRSAEELQVELQELRDALERGLPEGVERLGKPSKHEVGDAHYLRSTYEFENGLVLDRVGVVTPAHFARVDVLTWPQFRAAYDGVAQRVAESVR